MTYDPLAKLKHQGRTTPSPVSALEFQTVDGPRYGRVQIRNMPGHGFEVELGLPGILAATTPQFLGDGYTGLLTEFMPPAFYD